MICMNVAELTELPTCMANYTRYSVPVAVQSLNVRKIYPKKKDVSACSMIGSLRPDIVWFGEMPYMMEEINDALSNCDVFVAIGTSGNVFPAAGFVLQARMAGALCCEINLEPSMVQQYFDHGYYGQATEQVELFIKDLTKGKLRKSTEVEA